MVYLAVAALTNPHPLKHMIMLGMVRSTFANPITAALGGCNHCDRWLIARLAPGLILGEPDSTDVHLSLLGTRRNAN